MTAVAAISGCFSTWLSTVVLPLPRNPVSTVTGMRSAALIAGIGCRGSWLCLGRGSLEERGCGGNALATPRWKG